MCQEVFQIVQSMDLKSVELQLALQCAPLITNIKISNLLIISRESEDALRVVLKKTGISYFRLLRSETKTTFLLFRREPLEDYLARREVRRLLHKLGYEDLSLGTVLRTFQLRYKAYMEQEQGEAAEQIPDTGSENAQKEKKTGMVQPVEFPHEMGLLLGYPVLDVEGFIRYEGENFLYSGYWKVYDDVDSKKRLFKKYEEAKETLIQLLANEIEMRLIIEMYREDTYVETVRRYA